MIGLRRRETFEDRASLQQVRICAVGRIVRGHQRNGIEGRRLGIVGVLGGEAGHRIAVGAEPCRLVDLLEVGIQRSAAAM